MNFTPELPTKTGPYLWKKKETHKPKLVELFFQEPNHVARVKGYGLYESGLSLGGLWCRLVPSDELEKAFSEGYWQSHAEFAAPAEPMTGLSKAFKQSRARRVCNGEEVL